MPLIDIHAEQKADPEGLVFYPLAALPEHLPSPAGVVLPPDAELDLISDKLSAFAVIAIEFPKFRDGRGFTLARGLRQLGFGGDLRVIGHFLPDQFLALRDCGFSSFVTPAEHKPAQFKAVLAMPRQPGQLLRRSLHRALEAI